MARSADAAWEEGLEAAGMDARQRCPGSRPGEFILNPYENAGQLMGNMIGLGISTLTLGAMTVFLFASRFRPSSQPQDLPAWMYFILVVLLFLSCLLQAIAHAAIPAGENVTLLMVGRVLAALAMGCLLVIGTGLGEAHFSCRCWVAVWILSVGFATGFVVVVALSSSPAWAAASSGKCHRRPSRAARMFGWPHSGALHSAKVAPTKAASSMQSS